MQPVSYRIGVDIGGTFADFCALDEATGRLATLKVLSTPQEPGREVIAGLAELGSRFGIQPQDIGYFTHGTTVGINSVIQRKGIRLCLFTTENFVDVLEAGAPQDARPVSPHVEAGRAADHARPRAAGAPAHPGRRHRRNAARSCEPAPRARPGDRAGRRGHRAGAAAFLSQSGARAGGRAPDRPMGAGPAGVLLERRLADHPRIRAHRHRHHPRLRAAARGALPDGPAGGPETGRRRRRSHGDQVERRGHDRRARQVGLPADAAVGHRRRRHRRGLRGAPGRAGQGPEPRHRRHLGRCRHHRRRHADLRHRRDGRRLPDLHPDRLGDLDRRRRRLDRRGERVRHPDGRARKRRVDARSGLLRPRRHAAHHDRCLRGLRRHRPRQHRLRCGRRRCRQGARRRRHDRGPARDAGSSRPPRPSSRSRSPACTARSASSPRARASTRATSPCWRSAAPDR